MSENKKIILETHREDYGGEVGTFQVFVLKIPIIYLVVVSTTESELNSLSGGSHKSIVPMLKWITMLVEKIEHMLRTY